MDRKWKKEKEKRERENMEMNNKMKEVSTDPLYNPVNIFKI